MKRILLLKSSEVVADELLNKKKKSEVKKFIFQARGFDVHYQLVVSWTEAESSNSLRNLLVQQLFF